MLSNLYYVVFLFWFSSFCVPDHACLSGLFNFALPFRYSLPFQNAKFTPVFDGAGFHFIRLYRFVRVLFFFSFIFFLFCHIVSHSVLFYDLFIIAFAPTIHRLHVNKAVMIMVVLVCSTYEIKAYHL